MPALVATSGPTASATPTSGATTPAGTRRVADMISFSSLNDGWRARGGCDRSPHMRATADGGRTWTPVAAPAPHILRLQMTSASAGWVVGADASCAPTFYSTSNAGTTWVAATGLGQAWVVIGDSVRRPDGSKTAPCGRRVRPQALAAASTRAALVSCVSGVVRTKDGGSTWRPVATLPTGGQPIAAALLPNASGRGVLVVSGASGCSGLQVLRTTDLGSSWTAAACLDALAAPASVSLAPDHAGVIVARGGVARSTDSGRSWA